jgi:ubiquinone/menaquinone biosynthesis C-methylase UbiE
VDQQILARYNSADGAKSYTRKWQKHWTERVNNRTEQALLTRIFNDIGYLGDDSLGLDLPCGYGRLFPLVSANVARMVEGDWSFHLLQEAREFLNHAAPEVRPPMGFVRGTALKLPFADRTFDLVLSVRLCHHISSEEERLNYAREVLRISGNYAVFTYFDTDSVKNRVHRLSRLLKEKRAKWTLSNAQVRAVAEESDFEVLQLAPLSRLFSGHRFAVLKRKV